MNLAESIERGLNWLATPRQLPGRLEMETQRGKRFEVEIVSFAVRIPVLEDVILRLPVMLMVVPAGSSPVGEPAETIDASVDDSR